MPSSSGSRAVRLFFFKQKTAYEIGLGIPAEPLFRSRFVIVSIFIPKLRLILILNNSLKTKLSLLPKKLFRVRMSRNFGMKMLTMTNLSTECLIQLTKLGRSEERRVGKEGRSRWARYH